jgi:hypothetical protein
MKLSVSSLVLASAMLFVGTMAGEPASNLRGVETKKREYCTLTDRCDNDDAIVGLLVCAFLCRAH